MKIGFLSIFLSVMCLANQDTAVVRFANGDQLAGSAVSIGRDSISWQSSLLEEQANFKLSEILDLRLPSKKSMKHVDSTTHEAVVELTNGDIVKGALVAISDQQIKLKTWYAGELVFPRLNVKSININRLMKVLYRGPDDIKEWTISGGEESWKLENEQFISETHRGSIARNFDLPEEYEITFQINWRELLKARLVFGSSQIDTTSPSSGYEMNFQPSMINVRRLSDRDWLGTNSNQSVFRENESAKISVRVSKKTGKILLLVDDEPSGIWNDPALKENTGVGIHFISDAQANRNPKSSISISNIIISEWDGFLDEKTANDLLMRDQRINRFHMGMHERGEEMKVPLPDGRMILSNGDTIEGEVIGVEGDMIKLKTPFTEVIFPVHRLTNIPLKRDDLETAKLENGDVRASLSDGSKLVFRLDDVKDGKWIGYSQNFGHAQFDQSAFKYIEFNLYPKRKAN